MISKMFSLKGSRALVTGASSGVGRAVAEIFAEAGAEVVLQHASDIDQSLELEISAPELAGSLARRHSVRCAALDRNLDTAGAGQRLLADAEALFGPVDLLVLSASTQINQSLGDVTPEAFDLQQQVNVRSSFELLQAAVAGMTARRFGRIIFIGSVQQAGPMPNQLVYAGTKAAVHSYITGLAAAVAGDGVTCNTIAPGLLETPRSGARRRAHPDVWKAFAANVSPMGRAGTAEEVAAVALMLAAPAGAYITGECLYVAGGAQLPAHRTYQPWVDLAQSGSTT